MVRHVFDDVDQFRDWINEYVSVDRYKAYMTRDKEIVLIPRRSTRPTEYAYMKFDKDEDCKTIIEVLTAKKIRVWILRAEEWAEDRKPGIEAKIETEE